MTNIFPVSQWDMLARQSLACSDPNVYKVHDKSRKHNTTSSFSIIELNFQTLSPTRGREKRIMIKQTAYSYSVCILQHVDMIISCLAQLVAEISMLDC